MCGEMIVNSSAISLVGGRPLTKDICPHCGQGLATRRTARLRLSARGSPSQLCALSRNSLHLVFFLLFLAWYLCHALALALFAFFSLLGSTCPLYARVCMPDSRFDQHGMLDAYRPNLRLLSTGRTWWLHMLTSNVIRCRFMGGSPDGVIRLGSTQTAISDAPPFGRS
jgi:hypothetical protein